MHETAVDRPEGVASAFVAVWNAHDMTRLGPLLRDDAIWVPVYESRLDGRQAIVADFTEIHRDWAADTTIRARDVEARPVNPDVAVVAFMTDYLDGDQAVPGLGRAMMLTVARNDGVWQIAAGQITKPSGDG